MPLCSFVRAGERRERGREGELGRGLMFTETDEQAQCSPQAHVIPYAHTHAHTLANALVTHMQHSHTHTLTHMG